MGDLRVRVEAWPVAADQEALWLLSGKGPWVSGNVPADGEPHAELDYVLSVHGALSSVRLVHSTSWRVEGPAVVLTYIAVVDCEPDFAVAQWRDAQPITAELVEAVGAPMAGPAVAPPVVRHIDVLLHALRHLRFLLDHDAAARDVLGDHWRRHLTAFEPALAGMYEREQQPIAWEKRN